MVKTVFCLALLCITAISVVHGGGFVASDHCDANWIPFEDEKCVRLFSNFLDYNDAEGHCNQENATLVSIKTAAEQTFIRELVLTATSHIWIGAEKRSDSQTAYKWNDGTAVERFTHWAPNHPVPSNTRSCVIMRRVFPDLPFEWSNGNCDVPAFFICQKTQTWPVDYLQEAILEARRNKEFSVLRLTDQLSDLTIKLNNSDSKLKYLQDNPVPIGFVYTQLPDQPEPWRLWWTVEWTEITQQFAVLSTTEVGPSNSATRFWIRTN